MIQCSMKNLKNLLKGAWQATKTRNNLKQIPKQEALGQVFSGSQVFVYKAMFATKS